VTERDDELELVYQDLEACREMSKRHAMTAHLRLEALNVLLKAAREAVRYFSGAQEPGRDEPTQLVALERAIKTAERGV
jgi:hypothetical protein